MPKTGKVIATPSYVMFTPLDVFLIHLAEGWEPTNALDGTNHGEYSLLMVRYDRPTVVGNLRDGPKSPAQTDWR